MERPKKLKPVKGKFQVRENRAPVPHEEGFRHALENALAKTGWPAGRHEKVRVEFSATVEIYNPGHIVEYVVDLVPSH